MRLVLALMVFCACGIKGAPKPPLEATAADAPAEGRADGGCCGEGR
jgi:hypothetical protein